MTIDNFQKKTDETSGMRYIEYFEKPTKTRQHGLHPNPRVTNLKMFEIGGESHVELFNYYVSKRPLNLRETGHFYWSPK